MSTTLAPVLRQRFFDANGDPLAGGLLYSYVAGTSVPAATYADYSGLTPNTNPIVLDANGEANIWLGSGYYKFILEDANNVVQWTADDISAPGGGGTLTPPWTSHNLTDGQAATSLAEETVDFSLYTSAIWECEIIRGTTVVANGPVTIQNVNGTGQANAGLFLGRVAHGVTFSVDQVGMVATLKAACSTGPGNGTIKLRRTLIAI